jgi:hypothetical protein
VRQPLIDCIALARIHTYRFSQGLSIASNRGTAKGAPAVALELTAAADSAAGLTTSVPLTELKV